MPQDDDRSRHWLTRLKESDHALWLVFFISILDATVVPMVIEVILIPYMVARRDRLWRTAGIATAGCLVGAGAGYAIGGFFLDTLGEWAIDTFGWQAEYDRFSELFDTEGFWAVLVVGITPVPFQIATLAAGAAGYSVALFVLACTLARGVRYFGLALLVRLYGERAARLWEKRRWAAVLLLLAVLVALYLLTRWAGSALL